jgi:hypothetical protein
MDGRLHIGRSFGSDLTGAEGLGPGDQRAIGILGYPDPGASAIRRGVDLLMTGIDAL